MQNERHVILSPPSLAKVCGGRHGGTGKNAEQGEEGGSEQPDLQILRLKSCIQKGESPLYFQVNDTVR